MGFSWSISLFPFLLLGPDPVEMRFEQVFPQLRDATVFARSPGQNRAVVLIHGLLPHPLKNSIVSQPEISGWEKPGSQLVTTLGAEADVFAIGYGQNAPIDEVARAPALFRGVRALRALGYQEIVLIGHSAGALVARYFVEDWPNEGVTKVVQVCPPNGGSSWGKRTAAVRERQEAFITSMTKEGCAINRVERDGKLIPSEVEFVCVLGVLGGIGDGVVRADSQWPDDLQSQCVPAVVLQASHVTAMRSRNVALRLLEIIREPQPRWRQSETEAQRRKLFGAGK